MRNLVTNLFSTKNTFGLLFCLASLLSTTSCDSLIVMSDPSPPNVSVEILEEEENEEIFLQITRNDNELHKVPINFIELAYPIEIDHIYPIIVRDLNQDNEFEIVIEIFTRGTNCCTVTSVIYYDQKAGRYKNSSLIIKNWSVSAKLVDIHNDHHYEFITRNSNQQWIAPPAASVSPLQIFRFVDNQLVDVTNEYPEFLQEDANLWLAAAQGEIATLSDQYLTLTEEDPAYWAEYLNGKEQIVLSTYLAEMTMLGKDEEGMKQVNSMCKTEECMQYFEDLYVQLLDK